MRWCTFALCLLAWRTTAADLSAIVPPLRMIEEGLQMIELPLSEIGNSQAQRERRLIETEGELDLRESRSTQREKALNERELGLNGRELDLTQRGESLDAREARATRTERLLRYAPAVALVVFGAGFLTAVAMR